MDDLIARIEEIPLTGDDLTTMSQKLGNNNTHFVFYEDLATIGNLKELFGRSNTVFILFQIREQGGIAAIGHWAALIKNRHGVVYYDPYGLALSEDIALGGEPNWLDRLLRGTRVDINKIRHQRFRKDVNTCGRHTVSRALFYFMTNAEYDQLVIRPLIDGRSVADGDVYVSLLTAFLDESDMVVREFFMRRVNA